MSILRIVENIKNSPTRLVGMALSSAALVSLSLVAAPPAAQAKEKRSADATRTDSQAARTRPPANRSGGGSSSSASKGSSGQGRTPTATPRSSGSPSSTTVRHRTPSRTSEGVRSSDPRTRHPRSVSSSSQRHGYHSRDRGGYYGRRYVPYYGWIYGPGWSRYYYPGFYGASYYRPFYDGWWGSYWDWFFYTGATVRHDRVVRGGDYGPSGALDLDVSPEDAEVWIDGTYLGVADNFDGFPEYLWLPVGRTTVTFYLPGYETLTRDFDIRNNDVLKVGDSMRRGESVHPDDLRPAPRAQVERGTQPRPYSGAATYREDREERNAERRAQAASRRSVDEAWRERQVTPGSSEDVGRLYLSVEPSDASVYLDGVFFGTARELAQLSAGMVISPGEHVLQIVRPGYDDETREFSVDAGGDIGIELELEKN